MVFPYIYPFKEHQNIEQNGEKLVDTDKTAKTVSTEPRKRGLTLETRKVKRKSPQLTPVEKAEAAALWRSGEVTLEFLSKKFKKRPTAFSRLFKEMGIQKGEMAKAHQAKVTAEIESRLLSDASTHANRIAKVKEEHFRMADSMGKLVWQEIVAAKREGKKIENLRGTMQTLQLAMATMSKAREELYRILRVEEFEKEDEDNSLPELTVRELTSDETQQIRSTKQQDEDSLELEELEDLPSETPGTGP